MPPILVSVAVAAFTTLIIVLVAYLTYPVTGVKVEGSSMYPESAALDAIPPYASLLTINKDLLESRVESNVWVEGAEVNENWKSGIVTVQVEERRPMLYAEVDGREIVLSSDGQELPGLGGEDLDRMVLDRDQAVEILGFATTLHDNGMRVDSVDGAGAYGIRTTVQGRPVIFSGEVGDRRAKALKSVMLAHPEARRFDLRSPDRVVVGAPIQGNTDNGSRG